MYTIVISAWRQTFTLLGEKYFAFFSAPASLALLGKTQTHRADDPLLKAQENFRKEQTVSEKTQNTIIWSSFWRNYDTFYHKVKTSFFYFINSSKLKVDAYFYSTYEIN